MSLRFSAQGCHQQVKEALLDPNSNAPVSQSLEPGDWYSKPSPETPLKGSLPHSDD